MISSWCGSRDLRFFGERDLFLGTLTKHHPPTEDWSQVRDDGHGTAPVVGRIEQLASRVVLGSRSGLATFGGDLQGRKIRNVQCCSGAFWKQQTTTAGVLATMKAGADVLRYCNMAQCWKESDRDVSAVMQSRPCFGCRTTLLRR